MFGLCFLAISLINFNNHFIIFFSLFRYSMR